MPAKKTKASPKNTKRSTRQPTKTRTSTINTQPTVSGAAIVFAGAAVVSLGWIQDRDNIKLLLVGFGAALLVFGGAILAAALKLDRK